MKPFLVSLAVLIAMVAYRAAGRSSGQLPPVLVEEYGCGHGSHSSSADQTVGLFVDYNDWEGAHSGQLSRYLADEEWTAEIRFGRDLFANWCYDVFEPEAVVDEVWQLSGQIAIEDLPPTHVGYGGAAIARLTGMVAHNGDGETTPIGDLAIANSAWGCFAG